MSSPIRGWRSWRHSLLTARRWSKRSTTSTPRTYGTSNTWQSSNGTTLPNVSPTKNEQRKKSSKCNWTRRKRSKTSTPRTSSRARKSKRSSKRNRRKAKSSERQERRGLSSRLILFRRRRMSEGLGMGSFARRMMGVFCLFKINRNE